MPTGHYLPGQDVHEVQEWIKRSNYELFALTHLFSKYQIRSPLYGEGRLRGHKQARNLFVDYGSDEKESIFSTEMQSTFMNQPDYFMDFVDACVSQNVCNGSFASFTAYPYVKGIHSQRVLQTTAEAQKLLSVPRRFGEKYSSDGDLEVTKEEGQFFVNLNGKKWTIEEAIQDCDEYIHYANVSKESDLMREQELSEQLCRKRAQTPMAWIGLGHEANVIELCKRYELRIVSLIPYSSLEVRGKYLDGSEDDNLRGVIQLRNDLRNILT